LQKLFEISHLNTSQSLYFKNKPFQKTQIKMKGKQNFIIALFILWVSAANSQTPSSPTLEVVKGGYKINLGENMLDESA
jgi:hypothetical protein